MLSKRILLLLLGVFLIKCVLGFFLPLYADEAYYYIWSLFPRLSYYDHPAMVSWLISIGQWVLPFHSPLSVRFTFTVLSTLSLFIWLLIFKKKNTDSSKSLMFLGLFILNPLLGVGSILATPDVPLVFFWSLAYLFFLNLLESHKMRWYVLLGAALGLGFCSKYHIVLFVIFGLIVLGVHKEYKKLLWKGVLLTVGSGLIFSLPVLIWNYQNEWISFLFQLKHGFGRTYYKPEWTWGYLLGQFFILSPFVFLELLRFKSRSADRIFSLSQIGFFLTSTFKSVVEANWPLTSQPHAINHFVLNAEQNRIRWTFYYWGFIYVVLLALVFHPQGNKIVKSQLSTDDLSEISAVAHLYQPLYGPTYQVSSLLSWQTQTLTPKLAAFSRRDFFNELESLQPAPGQKFYVLKENHAFWPEYLASATFKKIQTFEKLELELYEVNYE